MLVLGNISVPVPDFVRAPEPPMTPVTVKESVLFTATVERLFVPAPLNAREVPFEPVRVPEKVVVCPVSVVSVEFPVTPMAPDVVTFPVDERVPPAKVNAAPDPPMLFALPIDRVPALIVVPPL